MDPQAAKYIGTGIAMLSLAGAGISIGMIGTSALSGIARNPEAQGNIMSAMILAIAFAESIAIYALVIAFLMLVS